MISVHKLKFNTMRSFIILLFSGLLFFSCSKEEDCGTTIEDLNKDECVQTFILKYELQLVLPNNQECIYYNIFKFKETYYFLNNCCVCDLIPSIVDCDNKLYAQAGDKEFDDFMKNAVRLQTILISK